MFKNVLVVCTGNICRSPFGQCLLNQIRPDINVDSAGTHALVGHPADAVISEAAKEYQVDLSRHKAQQISDELCKQYDLILAMQSTHMKEIANLSPVSVGKVMLYGEWLEESTIHDPYQKGITYTRQILSKIAQAAEQWRHKL